jgi:nucleoside-diphosphate-sugar epimerase
LNNKIKKIFITGGAGYVGSILVPYLLSKNYEVTVYDLQLYGVWLKNHNKLRIIKGDIRDINKIENSINTHDAIIHLACISNDPSFELNPNLGKDINLNSFRPLVEVAKKNRVKRFIFASSSSVYGIKEKLNVNEEESLNPLTDYSKYKVDCEKILEEYSSKDFITTTVRPATVCGYSPRQRLDVVVNIFANLAYFKREITVFGGDQMRANIHILDMARSYELILNAKDDLINNEKFNVGDANYKVAELASIAQKIIGDDVILKKVNTDDNRSYHISSDKITKILKFKNKKKIE